MKAERGRHIVFCALRVGIAIAPRHKFVARIRNSRYLLTASAVCHLLICTAVDRPVCRGIEDTMRAQFVSAIGLADKMRVGLHKHCWSNSKRSGNNTHDIIIETSEDVYVKNLLIRGRVLLKYT